MKTPQVRRWFFLSMFWYLLLISSCNKDELERLRHDSKSLQEQLDEANASIKLLTLKNLLNEQSLNDNLIKEIAGDINTGFTITFENDSLSIEVGLINSIINDKMNWKSTIEFNDNSIRIFPSLGTFSIADNSLILNPNGSTPLAALLRFTTPIGCKIRVEVKGRNGVSSDVVKEFSEVSVTHEIPILGLYPSYNNTINIILLKSTGEERAITSISVPTGELPDGMPSEIIVDVRQEDKMTEGMTLISYLGKNPSSPFFIDNYGDVRWVLDYSSLELNSNEIDLKTLSFDNGMERLKNGNFYFGDQSLEKIYEIDVLGKIINTITLSGYTFHHNVQEKPDGNFIVTVNKLGSTHLNGNPTIEDYVIELDRMSGAVLHEWDLKQSLDEYRITLIDNLSNDPIDWFHGNAVSYDPTDNTIIVSGRTQGVVKLDYDNKVKWILAPHKDWGSNRNGEDLNQFLLTPLDKSGSSISDQTILDGTSNHSDFEWNWYQHATLVKPNGNIMIFDNGFNRNYNQTIKYSRAVEYQIDAMNKTVKQVWEYGKDRGIETYSRIVSDVDYLADKENILFSPGFQVDNGDGLGGKIIEIDYGTKEVIFEVRINSSGVTLHRAERLNLYP